MRPLRTLALALGLLLAHALAAAQAVVIYARADEPHAQRVIRLAQAMQPTVHDRLIRPGDPWRDVMAQAIGQAAFVFVVWSRHSPRSTELAREIALARLAPDARVVPVLLDRTPLPSDLAGLHGVDWR